MEEKDPTEVVKKTLKTNAPPEVITVDINNHDDSETAAGESSGGTPTEQGITCQARTPKHANKKEDDKNITKAHAKEESVPQQAQWPYPQNVHSQYPPPSYNQGAFQPAREAYSSLPPMQVSPGGSRYYSYRSNSYDHRYSEFAYPQSQRYAHPHPPPHPPLYPHAASAYSFDGAPSRPPSSAWGVPPTYRGPEHYRSHNVNTNFSRAVSSSFDRSTKSGDKHQYSPKPHIPPPTAPMAGDSGSMSEDASWGALKHVHSVDEEEIRKRLVKQKERHNANKDVIVNQHHASNSSSLTNSPTDGVEGCATKKPELSKPTSKLDSLSSVASIQEPLETKAPSPDGSAFDLMKCPSGSSALLLPSHQRSLSHFSVSDMQSMESIKRTDGDEDREGSSEEEKRDERKNKKARTGKDGKSPLSITCSPPTSPKHSKKKSGEPKLHQPQAMYPHKGESPNAYDRMPSYGYHPLDTAPLLPPHIGTYPSIPRPGSSDSSTITPMHVDGNDMRQHPPPLGQIPSWEIQAQDSFGAASTGGGNPLMGSFSFQHDYPMLGPSTSIDHVHSHPPPPPPMRAHPTQTLESRNQSFDQYHGGFGRNDSMMSYEGRQQSMSFDAGHPVYQGQFPPHAPSWGSAGSYPMGYGYPHQRMGPPGMMRNYSEDSAMRNSPTQGVGGGPSMRMMPPNYPPPPPEFHAPPSMVNNKGAPQNTILSSPYQSSPKVGAFGWTKEEDARLTEIMKKYKNPRDWEPIAKDHNRGRTAKECHERWIRYLKPGVRKGQWTDHEDAIVMEMVQNSSEQPFTRWSDLAQRLPGRVGKQIRDRWVNHLNPAINHLPFSREDDLNLWEGHKKLGKRWVEISTKFFNNTRSENHIKNRWYSASFKKFITNEFGPDAYNGGKSRPSSPRKDSPKKKTPTRRPQNADTEQMEAV